MVKQLKRLLIYSLLFGIFIAVCQASELRITRNTGVIPAQSNITYNSFWDAVQNLDFINIDQNGLAGKAEQKNFFSAYRSLITGNFTAAEAGLYHLSQSASDPEIKQRSQELILQLWFSQSAWGKISASKQNWDLKSDPGLEFLYSMADTWSQFPPESYTFKGETILPLKLDSCSGHFLIEVTIHGKKYHFVIDTGAATSLISSQVAKETGVQSTGSVAFPSLETTVHAQLAVIDMTIGNVAIKNHPVIVVAKKQMEARIMGVKFFSLDGIIGWNALKNLTLNIDCPNKQLTINKPEPLAAQPSSRNLFWNGVCPPVVIVVSNQGSRLNFGLDTGTNESMFFANMLKKVTATQVRTKKIKEFAIGKFSERQVMIIADLVLISSGYVWHFKDIESMDSVGSFVQYDGLLGVDLLKKGLVTIDPLNGIFSFTQDKAEIIN